METTESKNKAFTVQEQLQQVKFAMDKAKQTEVSLNLCYLLIMYCRNKTY